MKIDTKGKVPEIVGCRVDFLYDKHTNHCKNYIFEQGSSDWLHQRNANKMYEDMKEWRSKDPRNTTQQESILGGDKHDSYEKDVYGFSNHQ